MPTGATVLCSASKGRGELTRDEAKLIPIGSGGKMRDCGASTSFYSSVTAALSSQEPRSPWL